MAFLATNNTKATPLKKTLQFGVRRRKRHFNKMNIIKLIFLGCCLTLILNPLFAQAKEANNNNATSKGENMLLNSDEDQQLGKKDKTNDNGDGTFKRLKPLDYKDLQQQLEEDVEKVEEEEQEKEKEELDGETEDHSSEVIEMIQPAHTLRHQEHYKQRILMAAAVKQKLQPENNNDNENVDIDNNNDDDDDYDLEEQEHELSQHNRNLRYQQIQLALREPIATSTNIPPLSHHHRRHEHHLAKQKMTKQTEFLWPQQQQQQHHLRHQHQHHKRPQLHHYLHSNLQMRKQNLTTNTKTLMHHHRYFDRESSNTNPWARMLTTEGPHLRHSGSNRNWKSINLNANPYNHLFNDEEASTNDDNNKNKEIENKDDDIKRFSLSLEGQENNKENKENPHNANANYPNYNPNTNNDHDDTNEEDEEDYSYEDDDKEINKSLKYPSIIAQTKTNVKRYTKTLNKPFRSSSYAYRSNQHNPHLRHTPAIKTNSNDNDDDYEEDNENSSDDSSNNEDDDKFSDEKWNKIEHEHYRKQLQHQRAMQALRSRRPTTTNDNNNKTPTININRYASYTPPASSSYNTAAWTKRQTVNEDDGDNIYSRYYIPGTVTRKKEEELGSPTAILESRRQYALQQRQNKALASAHHRRIVTEGSCRLPQPRVERIRRDSWKIYTPHCTILHRCADDAGCCPSERQTCAPKRTKNVDLYFFVISLNETQGSIEKLNFVNHTECHCVERSKQRAPEYGSSAAKDLINNNQIPYLRRNNILNCHCPNLFEKILQEDGYCRCDCSSGNMGCDWLKRGMEHFSMNDRKCIMEGRCKLPTCEYGQYIKKHGRCPRREERHLSADVDW